MSENWLHRVAPRGATLPVIVTAPHSGEWLPPEAPHLHKLPKNIILTDIDRFVHELYSFVTELGAWFLFTDVHRYAVDLNRIPDDIDADSVTGASHPSGKHTKGFHWVRTTQGAMLMAQPLSKDAHWILAGNYYQPFIDQLFGLIRELKTQHKTVYHIDVHSMPSLGTSEHVDPGQHRKDIVISDHKGKSCTADWLSKMTSAYQSAGFDVSVNWPYTGGRLSGITGSPGTGVQSIQVELNRNLYMNEETRQKTSSFSLTQKKLRAALTNAVAHLR